MKVIECPRDAMQGLKEFISTEKKVEYLNQLLLVGFDSIDCGSFVSPKTIPQMRDTGEVLKSIDQSKSKTELLVIVANRRGADEACQHHNIQYLGYPMSISETFQQKNTNRSIVDALNDLEQIIELAHSSNKKIVTYISMGFGNPYGDPYDEEVVIKFAEVLTSMGSDVISLADTIGVSAPEQIARLFTRISRQLPDKEIGAHLHSSPAETQAKIAAAYKAGCRRLDGALKGFGGCPMAEDELVGNVATEEILAFLKNEGESSGINEEAFAKALQLAAEIFPNH
jgi:hydroxymethylglutaryl-CoA lyase